MSRPPKDPCEVSPGMHDLNNSHACLFGTVDHKIRAYNERSSSRCQVVSGFAQQRLPREQGENIGYPIDEPIGGIGTMMLKGNTTPDALQVGTNAAGERETAHGRL
jgi:hypothetical protein